MSMTADFIQSTLANATLGTAVVGGCLIGLAATWLYLSIGRIAGISGIAARALREAGWPLLFILGLGIGGWLATLVGNSLSNTATMGTGLPTQVAAMSQSWPWLVVGGLLVGFGTRMGSGCTSGHGVCGIARFSPRSMVATCVFVGTGMIVATLIDAAGLNA